MRIQGIIAALVFTATPALAQTAGTSPTFSGVGSASGSESVERDEGSLSLAGTRESESRHAWYVGPTFGATYVNGDYRPIFGARGVFRINKKFGIGLAANGFDFDDANAEHHLEGGYGGVLMEYVLVKGETLQLFSGSTIGGGAFCPHNPGQNSCEGAHGFFVSEPTLNLEINATSYMRVAAGAGYRFALAHEHQGITGSDLSGFVSRVALEFGSF